MNDFFAIFLSSMTTFVDKENVVFTVQTVQEVSETGATHPTLLYACQFDTFGVKLTHSGTLRPSHLTTRLGVGTSYFIELLLRN